jgi:hypothetical protein
MSTISAIVALSTNDPPPLLHRLADSGIRHHFSSAQCGTTAEQRPVGIVLLRLLPGCHYSRHPFPLVSMTYQPLSNCCHKPMVCKGDGITNYFICASCKSVCIPARDDRVEVASSRIVSNCCSSPLYPESDICKACGEHAEGVLEEEEGASGGVDVDLATGESQPCPNRKADGRSIPPSAPQEKASTWIYAESHRIHDGEEGFVVDATMALNMAIIRYLDRFPPTK